MGILDELREQAENKKSSTETENERKARLYKKYLTDINPKLQQFYNYLHELIAHLNYINMEIKASYDLPVVGISPDFKQGGYRLVADSDEEMKDIKFQFVCQREGEFCFSLDNRAEVERIEDFLLKNHIQFYCKKEKDQRYNVISGEFKVKPAIPVLIRLTADLAESRIVMTIVNFDMLGCRKLILTPEQINEDFLDRFGNYVLRRTAELVQTKLSEEEMRRIRDQMLLQQREQEEELRQLALAEEARLAEERAAKKGLLTGLFAKDKP